MNQHLYWMCETAPTLPCDKQLSWLGFIEGATCAIGVIDLGDIDYEGGGYV